MQNAGQDDAPIIDLLMEDAQQWHLDSHSDGHIVLYRVQSPQHQVEQADCIA